MTCDCHRFRPSRNVATVNIAPDPAWPVMSARWVEVSTVDGSVRPTSPQRIPNPLFRGISPEEVAFGTPGVGQKGGPGRAAATIDSRLHQPTLHAHSVPFPALDPTGRRGKRIRANGSLPPCPQKPRNTALSGPVTD